MKFADIFRHIRTLHIETAPLIYFIEQNVAYVKQVKAIFKEISDGTLQASTSVITLTEVLSYPMRLNRQDLISTYQHILTNSKYFSLVDIDKNIAEYAAQLRAVYNFKTPDALQVATAIKSGCDAILTNDKGLVRLQELQVVLVDDIELDT